MEIRDCSAEDVCEPHDLSPKKEDTEPVPTKKSVLHEIVELMKLRNVGCPSHVYSAHFSPRLFPNSRRSASRNTRATAPTFGPAAFQSRPSPSSAPFDRLLGVWLSQLWTGWQSALLIVKPETVIAWHRVGFRLFWRWKSRHREGRPSVSPEVRDLIRRMSLANPRWGAPRIHGELLKLGIQLSQATVAKYIVRHRKPPSQTWRTFLQNHMKDLVSADFFVVPTIAFRVLFVFVILAHDRRRPIHFAVMANPSAEWTARQLLEAFPWDTAPRYLLRDRDGNYGEKFQEAAE
jgi:hypothetical protein